MLIRNYAEFKFALLTYTLLTVSEREGLDLKSRNELLVPFQESACQRKWPTYMQIKLLDRIYLGQTTWRPYMVLGIEVGKSWFYTNGCKSGEKQST